MIELTIADRHRVKETVSLRPDIHIRDLLLSTYKPREIFKVASDNWSKVFEVEDTDTRIVRLLSAGNLHDQSVKDSVREELEWMSALRKTGTRFVDAWRMLDTTFEPPSHLKKLVKSIGLFKDAVWSRGLIRYDSKKLQKQLLEYDPQAAHSFTPTDFETFYENYLDRISRIADLLRREELTLEEHHTLRKAVRTMRHYYGLVAKATSNPDAALVEKFLNQVSVEMGKAQIQIIHMEARGEVDPNEDTTVIKPEHRQIITEFLRLHGLD